MHQVLYDDLGRRSSLTRFNGVTTSYGYDGASRLTSLTHNLFGATHDQTYTLAYNPAGQIVSEASSNAVYDWRPGADFTDYYTDNGLNQYETAGGLAVTHEARGNTTDIGAEAYGFNARNQLTTANAGDTLSYDPAGRLYEESATATTRFQYAGGEAIAEEDGAGAVLRRYVKGSKGAPTPFDGVDETLVW